MVSPSSLAGGLTAMVGLLVAATNARALPAAEVEVIPNLSSSAIVTVPEEPYPQEPPTPTTPTSTSTSANIIQARTVAGTATEPNRPKKSRKPLKKAQKKGNSSKTATEHWFGRNNDKFRGFGEGKKDGWLERKKQENNFEAKRPVAWDPFRKTKPYDDYDGGPRRL